MVGLKAQAAFALAVMARAGERNRAGCSVHDQEPLSPNLESAKLPAGSGLPLACLIAGRMVYNGGRYAAFAATGGGWLAEVRLAQTRLI